MTKTIPNEVVQAFEILLEEIEQVINVYIKENAVALDARDFTTARKMIERAELITNFRQKVDAIRREWGSLGALPYGLKTATNKIVSTINGRRLPRGVRTPEDAYYRPILEVLVAMGGSATVADVLEQMGAKMKAVLKGVDRQTLPQTPNEVRWHNTAKWARNTLVQDGRLKSGSRFGVWEISEKGRQWLKNNSSNQR
jgi:hypothetical protein